MKHIKLLPLLTLPLLLLTGCDNNDIHGYTIKIESTNKIYSNLTYTTDNYTKTQVRRYNDTNLNIIDYVYVPQSLFPQYATIYMKFDVWYQYNTRIGYYIANKIQILPYENY